MGGFRRSAHAHGPCTRFCTWEWKEDAVDRVWGLRQATRKIKTFSIALYLSHLVSAKLGPCRRPQLSDICEDWLGPWCNGLGSQHPFMLLRSSEDLSMVAGSIQGSTPSVSIKSIILGMFYFLSSINKSKGRCKDCLLLFFVTLKHGASIMKNVDINLLCHLLLSIH